MTINKIAAFSLENQGGNPAGVLLCKEMLTDLEMLNIAKEVNYSETAFIAQQEDSFRIRYFSPQTEIAFCGHATIASGKVLGETYGEGNYTLILNDGEINLKVEKKDDEFFSTFSSVETHTKDMDFEVAKEILDIFNLKVEDLDPRFPIKVSFSGNYHPIIFVNSRETLKNINYDFDKAKELMENESFTTVSILFCENELLYHSRNAFAFGGVYEDPATGSAAVALAEYLRNIKFKVSGEIEILQGFDMNVPCRIIASYEATQGSSVDVSGQSRLIKEESK